MALQIKALPVSEENYAETMRGNVEPYLADLREDGFFKGCDGNEIHYELYPLAGAEGGVVISHGFTESAEKFREMIYNFLQMQFSVYIVDHRGHGKSYRRNPDDPETVSVKAFDEYVEDLAIFVDTLVKPKNGALPLYLYAHSMGGAIAVQFLQTHPGVFQKAVLSAPMIQAQMPIPPAVTTAMCNFFIGIGKGDKRVFVHKGFDPAYSYDQSHDTSKARFDYYHAKRKANRHLQTASASYRWVRESVRVAKRNLDPARCAKITIPVLLCQPEVDTSVISEKENEFISLIPDGRLVQFRDCRHEIYAAVDSTVFEYLQTIEKFLKGESD